MFISFLIMIHQNKSNSTMKKEILVVLLDGFSDWEGAFIAPLLNQGVKPGNPITYQVKILAAKKEPLTSLGGIQVLPHYDVQTMPQEYAGLILIGGSSNWFSDEAKFIIPLVENAIKENKLVAGICNASVFLGLYGFLNTVKHTSNTLAYLKHFAGENYKGDPNYVDQPAVRDGNVVTANGTAYLEFCREILYALKADSSQAIEESYIFFKENGLGKSL